MVSDDMLIHLSTAQGQNKLAIMLANYLTRDELLEIDLHGMTEFWRKHQGRAFQNSPEGIKNNNTIYKIKFAQTQSTLKLSMRLKSAVSPYDLTALDCILFEINYRGKFDVEIKVSPNPMNPKFISLAFGKAINYSSYKGMMDKLYNKRTIHANFTSMAKTLLATRPNGLSAFRQFFIYLMDSANSETIIGTVQVYDKLEFVLDVDYIGMYSFSIRDIETERIEKLFLEAVPVEIHGLLVIFGDIMKTDKTL